MENGMINPDCEFCGYFSLMNSMKIIGPYPSAQNLNYRIYFVNGCQFHYENSEELTNNLNTRLELISPNYIAYHQYSGADLKSAFEKKFNNVKIVEFSSASDKYRTPFYDNILKPLAEGIKKSEVNNDLLKNLWIFFTGDPILEAKLELLHSLLLPPADFTNFEKWNDLQNSANYENGAKEIKAWNTFINGNDYSKRPFDQEYLTTLSELRDALFPEFEEKQ
ncbi:MAG: hypothetical protein A2309_01410 [Bacteroidetes bacterium RIFOXYB2_FULL_35_7]|nr:MAG: hypothetical protein A2X01_18080 [Bacteroidetes bacterium GWF2_35_48]OFY94509.1 MAG: hypothetical protein A2309_01410 [Bacteroidetes bacterium RIFOXYB2_FULL_35_7]HBX51712.1 hypothetical protein [Bacteroidales bacterium]